MTIYLEQSARFLRVFFHHSGRRENEHCLLETTLKNSHPVNSYVDLFTTYLDGRVIKIAIHPKPLFLISRDVSCYWAIYVQSQTTQKIHKKLHIKIGKKSGHGLKDTQEMNGVA